ncbi:MAG: hypothetical protein ACR2HE_03590 [Casimicrobiaceae bacterium]
MTFRSINESPQVYARLAGGLYIITIVAGSIALVSGSGGLVANLIAAASYIAVTVLFYYIFRPVNKGLSLLAAFLSLGGCALSALSAFHLIAVPFNPLAFFGFYCLLIGYLVVDAVELSYPCSWWGDSRWALKPTSTLEFQQVTPPSSTLRRTPASVIALMNRHTFLSGYARCTVFWIALVMAVSTSDTVAAGKATTGTARVALADCAAKLDAQGGGWCEMSGASISDVFPKQLSDTQRGWTGPSSIITAWNGAAWDARRRKWYFHGGGHSDYGGNEVYEFDLTKATFTRLTDPAPVPAKTAENSCPNPEHGPRSQHTYDGFLFSAATDTIWLLPSTAGYCLGGMVNMLGQVWEFNPDVNQSRNGLAPLTWRRHQKEMPVELRGGNYLRTAEMPDGSVIVWSNHRGAHFDPGTGEWKLQGSRADWGEGNAVYDPVRNTIWETSGAFLRMAPGGDARKIADAVFGVHAGAGIAVTESGEIYIWSGASPVVRFEPDAGKWSVALNHSGPPRGGPVYSKWIYLQNEKLFLGYSSPTTGVWVYKVPASGWRELPTRTAQSYIDDAANGSQVRIPPGLYVGGIQIDKDLTVDITGVVFDRPVGGKANVLVENAKRKITVVLLGYDMPGANINGNGAAIRADYDFDLTVRKFHVRGSNMGILTGNRGGKLVLEDGLIEEACCGTDLSHGVYMGLGVELVIRRVTVTNLRRLGHLVKSRAAKTTVEDSRLLGGEGRYSREFEAPNGGIIVLRRNTIQKGVNTDNAESIAIGVEASDSSNPARSILPTSFEFTQNSVIFDRKAAPPEPAHGAGVNQFGKWRNLPPGTPMKVFGNTFVNMRSWGEFPDLSAQNRMFPTRTAAGMNAAAAGVVESSHK